METFIKQVMVEHGAFLLRLGLHMLNNRMDLYPLVEESVQDVFMLLPKHYEALKTHPNLRGWLCLSLKNRLIQKAQKERKRLYSLVPLEQVEALLESPLENSLDKEDTKKLLEQAMEGLNEGERELIRLYYLKNYSSAQIAVMRNTSTEVINTQLYRARKKLKKFLENSDFLFMLFWIFLLL